MLWYLSHQNLYVSTWALTLSFVVWTLWATIAAQLNQIGFHFTDAEIFTLASLPGLVGATCRLFYTYMPAIVGGKNWTLFSTALIPFYLKNGEKILTSKSGAMFRSLTSHIYSDKLTMLQKVSLARHSNLYVPLVERELTPVERT